MVHPFSPYMGMTAYTLILTTIQYEVLSGYCSIQHAINPAFQTCKNSNLDGCNIILYSFNQTYKLEPVHTSKKLKVIAFQADLPIWPLLRIKISGKRTIIIKAIE